MFAYDKTFDPKVVLVHYDLISRFSDFPLYLGTQLVYEHTSFTICLPMTRPLTVKYSWATVTLFHGSVTLPYILTLSWYFYAPNFEKVGRAYCFGLVRVSVFPCVRTTFS